MKNCHLCEGELYAVIDNREYCEECFKQWLKDFKSEWDEE